MCAQLDSLLIVGQGSPDVDALSDALEEASHHVTIVDAGHLRLESLGADGVGLVFLQFDTPGIDSNAVIRKFKSGEGWPKPLVILVGSDYSQSLQRRAGELKGRYRAAGKPKDVKS